MNQYFIKKNNKNMASNKDIKNEAFNLSKDHINNNSFPNNSVENINSGKENKRDNSRPNSYPSIFPNVNNPQNENDNSEYDRLNDRLNFDGFIDVNINNPQNEYPRLNNSLIFHSSNVLNECIPLNENSNIECNILIPKDSLNFHSLNYQNANIPLNENDSFEYDRLNESFNFNSFNYLNINNTLNENDIFEYVISIGNLNFHNFIDINVNNSQFENDNIEYGRINDSFNFHQSNNININDSQYENDNIEYSHINDINVNNPQFENDNIENDSINIDNISDRSIQKFAIQKIEKEFNTNSQKIQKRNDYAKKYFKSYFSKFLKNLSNKVIQKSQLPQKFKKKKIYSPNSLSFTANTKKSDDYKFLSFTVKKILTYYIKEKSKNKYQKKNKETIEDILNFIDESEDESLYEEVKSFFNMTLEDAYELFYQDEEFKKFKEDIRVIKIDEEVKAINGASLREKNGFIQLVKSYLMEN